MTLWINGQGEAVIDTYSFDCKQNSWKVDYQAAISFLYCLHLRKTGIFTDAADPLDEEIILIENRKKSAYFVFYH